ncbi:MAG: hypothetical protein M3Y86_06470 [Verrucomicrobiota bacterium]|nr:hypothetical protein [Verrucomicrobiota bacterium]
MMEDATTIVRRAAQRGLPSLVIGANAVILLGYTRNTTDFDLLIPEEKRSEWLDLMRDLGFRFFHGTDAFVQLEAGQEGGTSVDLMFVDALTWEKLRRGARNCDFAGERVLIPRPEFLVALKLHAANSATRSKPATDWEDIRQIVRICALDPEEQSFRDLILRYGGEDGLARIRDFARQ